MMQRKFQFPTTYDRNETKTITIPTALIPVIAGKLDELKWKSAWQSDADWQTARNEIQYVIEKLYT